MPNFPFDQFFSGFQIILSAIFIPFLLGGYQRLFVKAVKKKASQIYASDKCLENTICSSLDFYNIFRITVFALSIVFLISAGSNILSENAQQRLILPVFFSHIAVAILFVVFWARVYHPIAEHFSDILSDILSER